MKQSSLLFRKAQKQDLDAVERIYDRIHALEDAGRMTIGWVTGVYPVRSTAEAALACDTLYVCETQAQVAASAIINQQQVDVYANANWRYPAEDSRVLVLHTLTVDPEHAGCGIGRAFAEFYERCARKMNCEVLRLDTNERNKQARRLYAALGYREADLIACEFNHIPGVRLVLLEKHL